MSGIYLKSGEVIGDQCEVIRPIGIGKMGVVYQCRSLHHQETPIALKVLTLSGSKKTSAKEDSEYLTRFQNEFAATYSVNSPYVVQTFSYIVDPKCVGYTMEFIDGGDLRKLLRLYGKIPIPNLVRLLIQACNGVQSIHDEGIIHRDLKPANILLTPEGDVKITDFGIAKMTRTTRITAAGNLLGTFEYLSPQYLQDGVGTTLCDIYALGIIGFEMAAGITPFNETDLFNMITAKVDRDPPKADKFNSECPQGLVAIIDKALSRKEKDRYQSAEEMGRALEEFYRENGCEEQLVQLPIEADDKDETVTEQISFIDELSALSIENQEMHKLAELSSSDDVHGGAKPTRREVIPPNFFQDRGGFDAEEMKADEHVSLVTARPEPRYSKIWSMSSSAAIVLVLALTTYFLYSIASVRHSDDSYDQALKTAIEENKPTGNTAAEGALPPEMLEIPSEWVDAEPASVPEPSPEPTPLTFVDISEPVLLLEDTGSAPADEPPQQEEAVTAAPAETPAPTPSPEPSPLPTAQPTPTPTPTAAPTPVPTITAAPSPPQTVDTTGAEAVVAINKQRIPAETPASVQIAETTPVEPPPAQAEGPVSDDISLAARVRATLLFRFADYIEWPSRSFHSNKAPIQLCVFGRSSFVEYLAQRAPSTTARSARSFNILRLRLDSTPIELTQCHVLYLGSKFSNQANRVAAAINTKPVLLVTENSGDGIIDFVPSGRTIKFAVNQKRAQQAGIQIGSVLLDLAVEKR